MPVDIGIDMGTSNTVICVGKSIVLDLSLIHI